MWTSIQPLSVYISIYFYYSNVLFAGLPISCKDKWNLVQASFLLNCEWKVLRDVSTIGLTLFNFWTLIFHLMRLNTADNENQYY